MQLLSAPGFSEQNFKTNSLGSTVSSIGHLLIPYAHSTQTKVLSVGSLSNHDEDGNKNVTNLHI